MAAPVLAHSPADVVRHALIQLGLGTLPSTGGDWPVYVGSEPTEPDNVVTVYDTTPVVDGRSMPDGELLLHRGVQVRVRALDHATLGHPKADAILRGMTESVRLTQVTIAGTQYLLCALTRLSGVIRIGKETPTSKREVYTINATAPLRRLN